MVDLGPLDPESLRAVFEAAKLGKEIFGDGKRSDERPSDSDSGTESTDPPDQPASAGPSDVNNPTIGTGGIIGNLTVNNIYVDTSGESLDVTTVTCCYDYPDGLCPHRRT